MEMEKNFFGRAFSIAAAAVMLVDALAAFPASAEKDDVNFEEFFASAGGVKQVSLGNSHSAAVTTNGDLYTWGYNDDGQLGNGAWTSITSADIVYAAPTAAKAEFMDELPQDIEFFDAFSVTA